VSVVLDLVLVLPQEERVDGVGGPMELEHHH